MTTATLFLIGQNSRGQWIAQTQAGRTGGIFVSQAAALKFALMENGNRKEHVITVPSMELDLGERTLAVVHSAPKLAPVARATMPTRTVSQPSINQAA